MKTYLPIAVALMLSNAVTTVSGEVSILLQEGGQYGRRHGRERYEEPYRSDRREYWPAPYSRVYAAPQPYVQQSLPYPSGGDLTTVSQQLYDVKQLLDKKGSQGDITQAQYRAEADYLAQIDKDAHSTAFNQGGHLSDDQAGFFLQQLQELKIALDQDLAVH